MRNRFVAVSQFDGTTNLLKIELPTGNRELIKASNVDENLVSFGLFEYEMDGSVMQTVALLATPEGPKLYLNDLEYRPQIYKTKIEVKDEDDFSHFRVLHDDRVVFGLFYRKKFGIGLHPYNNTREDIDFYYWLSIKINDTKFYQTYTREFIFIE